MQLHIARLCLNCDEIHDQLTCPICSSESFAYISRWVPAPERRTEPRRMPSPETAEIYKQLLHPTAQTSGTNRWVKRGAVGLGLAALAGWAWRRNVGGGDGATDATPSEARDGASPGKDERELLPAAENRGENRVN